MKNSQRHRSRVVWWLDPVSVLKADANEPMDHQGEWQNGEDREEDEPRRKAGKTCCWPRKKDPVAMKSPKHIRQRYA